MILEPLQSAPEEFFVLMTEEIPLTKGERLKATKSYDLFDEDVMGKSGLYIKTDAHTGKHLVYFPFNEEWAELPPDSIERQSAGEVSDSDRQFVGRVKTLVYTLEV